MPRSTAHPLWNLKLENAKQQELIITEDGEPAITVDDTEVAPLHLPHPNNKKVRRVIDTMTSKAVLIFGRFTAERKAVLEALREELRQRDHLPISFDYSFVSAARSFFRRPPMSRAS